MVGCTGHWAHTHHGGLQVRAESVLPEASDEAVDLGLGEPEVRHTALPAQVAGHVLSQPL